MAEAKLEIVVELEDRASDKLAHVGSTALQLGTAMTAGITLPIAGAGAAITTFANDFNEGMANVSTLIPDATDDIAGLGDEVQALAIETASGTREMADGLYEVVSAFGYTNDSIELLDINARAARAGLTTTADAVALTSAVTRGYNDTSAEAVQHTADLAFMTTNLGQTTFPELAASIGSVTPLAAALGVAQEDLFAVMATATGVTGGASEVSTQFRGVLQSLMAPTAEMASLMAEYGYESGEAMLAGEGLQGTINAIVAAAERSGKPLQDYIGSIEGQTLALALAGPQADTFTQRLADMQNVAGATDAAFRAQTQGVNETGFAMEQTRSRLRVLAEDAGQALLPAINGVIGVLTPLIAYLQIAATWFGSLDPRIQTTIVVLVALAAAVGPVLVVLGSLASGISAVVAAAPAVIAGLTAVAGVLSGPVLLVIGLVVAAVAALYLAWSTNFLGIRDVTTSVMTIVSNVIQTVLLMVATWWQQHGQSVMTIVNTYASNIRFGIELVMGIIEAIQAATLGRIVAIWQNNGSMLSAIHTNTWDTIRAVLQAALDYMGGAVDAFAALLAGDWEGLGNALRAMQQATWDGMTAILQGAAGNIIAAARHMGTSIHNGIAAGAEGAVAAVRAAIGAIIDILNAAIAIYNSLPLPNIGGGSGGGSSGFARGSHYSPAGSFLVGEYGPERVFLPRGTSVMPADRTQRMERSGGVEGSTIINLTLTVNGASAGIGREVEAAAQRAVEQALRAAGQRADTRLRTA